MRVTSKNLRAVTELTLMADLKPGLVNVSEPIAYSGRLKVVLSTLAKLRQASTEQGPTVPLVGALERLRTLHFFNWSLFDHDRRLLLTVAFDGPWEPYIRQIVELAGPLLDIIFCHCTDYEKNSCLAGYPRFSEWVRDRQVQSDLMYSAVADLTVDDLRYLQQFEREAAHKSLLPGQAPAILRAPDLDTIPAPASAEPLLAALGALFPLRRLFASNGKRTASNEVFLFDRAVESFTRHLRPDPAALAAALPLATPTRGATTAAAAQDPFARWVHDLPSSVLGARERPAPELRSPATLQGNILGKYLDGEQEPTHGCLALLCFDEPTKAAQFLTSIRSRLTLHADRQGTTEGVRLNLALTYRGLQAAGASPTLLARFPKEFQEGMAQRAGLLGDVGRNHPSTWEQLPRNWPLGGATEEVDLSCVDAVLTFQTSAQATDGDHVWSAAHPLYSTIRELANEPWMRGVHILHVQALRRFPGGHLGLVDGISQPSPRTESGDPSRDSVALGELLLGYANERDETSSLPVELAVNSTFLAIRKMAQDVSAFDEVSLRDDLLKAKMLGRYPDGKPLLPASGANDFDYTGDRDGRVCPLFSHIRRANPRQDKTGSDGSVLPTPRILRRGFSYGSEFSKAKDEATRDAERGVLFMGYCASIADQFEVIQSWVNGGNSTGGFGAHPDFIAGPIPERDARAQTFFDGKALNRLPVPSKPIARLRWGLYLFVPSLDAIDYIIALAYAPQRAPIAVVDPPAAINHLAALEAPVPGETAEQEQSRIRRVRDEWRRFLEDPTLRDDAAAIWKYVRDRGGALRTSYGVLAGSLDTVTTVLAEGKTYSVREYWQRMERSFGGHYLGMDEAPGPNDVPGAPPAPPGYLEQSERPNEFLSRIGYSEAFDSAWQRTLTWFAKQNGMADLRSLSRTVISEIAQEWFGLPDFAALMNDDADPGPPIPSTNPPQGPTAPPARCPVDFLHSSQYIFRPNPTAALEEVAIRRGRVIFDAAKVFVNGTHSAKGGPRPTLLEVLRKGGYTGDCNAAVVGAINGFTVPTSSSLVSILDTWIETLEIGRLRQWYSTLPAEQLGELEKVFSLTDFRKPLADALLRAFVQRPVPDLLHRTAVARSRLGRVDVEPGDRIVMSLGAAALDAHGKGHANFWTLLFGGDRSASSAPAHACPGQSMAFGTLFGVIAALLSQRSLRRKAKLTLGYDVKHAVALAAAARARSEATSY